jgi:hypothetical protein
MTGWIATGAEAGVRRAVTCTSNRRYSPAWALFVLAATAPVALAQSANCDAFKERLAASIESNGVRGYALEIVPSGSPAPLGARSLGTCDGGAYTVLYWRWAQARGEAAPAAPPTSVADAPAATPRPAQAAKTDAEPSSRREPKAMSEVNAEREPNATRESKPSTGEMAARESHSAAMSRPPSASPSAAPEVADETNPPPAASPASMPPTAAPSPAPTSAQGAEQARFAGFARVVAFVVAAAAVIVGGVWAWRWMRYRRYYDEAGLPRRPRITLR